jgi:Tim17/Tim22/Tim23/Pmp24 family
LYILSKPMSSSKSNDDHDAGAPLPDFRASSIQLQTIAPALGVTGGALQHQKPDYLEYDAGGRGIIVTMFANAGMAYLMGIGGGGLYGFRQGLAATPSNRFRVQLNSVLNHTGRYGSRAGNTLGVFAVLYSLYEGLADHVRLRLLQNDDCSPS